MHSLIRYIAISSWPVECFGKNVFTIPSISWTLICSFNKSIVEVMLTYTGLYPTSGKSIQQ